MDWNTAFRVAQHPNVETFKWFEEDIFRFRLKDGFFFYDEENNKLDELGMNRDGKACSILFVTDSEDDFNQTMSMLITEAERVQLGLEILDESADEDEAFFKMLVELARRNGDWPKRN
jgi:hypothetical protein